MAALQGERLWRVPLQGKELGKPKSTLKGRFGRLRTVEVAPGGSLWITTSNDDGRGSGPDRVIRLRRQALTQAARSSGSGASPPSRRTTSLLHGFVRSVGA